MKMNLCDETIKT